MCLPPLEKILPYLRPDSIEEARSIQTELQPAVRLEPMLKMPGFVAGADAAFLDDEVIGVACLFTYPDLSLIEEVVSRNKVTFPYVPGYLVFREGAVLIEAIYRLSRIPDLIFFDGQGIAHARSMGIASFIGVLLDLPTIGCAKSGLVGSWQEPGKRQGQWSPLEFRNRLAGAVLRSRTGVKPIFVSPGHKMDVASSLKITLNCLTRFRIPEPLRIADILSRREKSRLRKEQKTSAK